MTRERLTEKQRAHPGWQQKISPTRLSKAQWRSKALLDDAGDDLSLTDVVRISGRQMPMTVPALRHMIALGGLPFAHRDTPRGPRIATRDLAAFLRIPLDRDQRPGLRSTSEGTGGRSR